MIVRVGITQGRLLPPVDGHIQCFPADGWRDELALCGRAGYDGVEWIHTTEPDPRNPIAQAGGWREIAAECDAASTRVMSGCYDALMSPRVLEDGAAAESWERHFAAIRVVAENLAALGATHVVIPLLGENRVRGDADHEAAIAFVRGALDASASSRIGIHLETSLPTKSLRRLVEAVDDARCRVTFDTGNIVQFGRDCCKELESQLPIVGSVHLKDSTAEGTVPFGHGRVNFREVARLLIEGGFRGDCVVQGARIQGERDLDVAHRYAEFARGVFDELD